MPFPFTHGGSLSWLWTAASGTSLPAGGPAGGDPLQLCAHRDGSPSAALPLQCLLWGTDTSAKSHPPKPLYRESADGIRDPLVDLAQRPWVLSSRVAGFTSATWSEQGITQWGEEPPP